MLPSQNRPKEGGTGTHPSKKSGTREECRKPNGPQMLDAAHGLAQRPVIVVQRMDIRLVHHSRPPLELVAEKGDDDQE